MKLEDIVIKLIFMDDNKRDKVLLAAANEYLDLIYNITSDIYDSNIHEFYSQYTPTSYRRHGNIEGFNLYRANDIDRLTYKIVFNEKNLLKYGKKRDKRKVVLEHVFDGKRGGKGVNGFPIEWEASYPNNYSEFSLWEAEKDTLYSILQQFLKDCYGDDLLNIFWYMISKRI